MSKFIAGALSAQACMVPNKRKTSYPDLGMLLQLQLELPHVNVLTKLDLMDEERREELDRPPMHKCTPHAGT